ncbi:hypothetical protein CYMTET_19769 [Cymbomonas tetramitiformis]|uniref:Uncharacterized protein n=1 Tax=Cymbomonas tetramitiformis TaxID=36881 RepID=A0AAE0G5Z8_9CHLO|nr:hypothetical protein CYMTET_19769 [Cymbomonas tetramitiformis]
MSLCKLAPYGQQGLSPRPFNSISARRQGRAQQALSRSLRKAHSTKAYSTKRESCTACSVPQNSGPDATAPRRGPSALRVSLHALPQSQGGWNFYDAIALNFRSLLTSKYDKAIFGIALPALCAILLDPLMSLVDTAIVGQLGAAPLAGTGMSTIVFTFSSVLFAFLTTATTPLVAGANARGDAKAASETIVNGLWLAGLIGTVMCAMLLCGASWIPSKLAQILGRDERTVST